MWSAAVFGLELSGQKDRKAGFQPLPRLLITTLCDFVAKGSAGKMYERNYKKGGSKNSLPVDPLLYGASHTDRVLKIDLEAAGIPQALKASSIFMRVALHTSTYFWNLEMFLQKKYRNWLAIRLWT